MRNDYHVLSKGPLDGPWDLAALRQRFVEGGFDGLNLWFMSPAAFKNLDFLADYNDLQYLEVTGKLNNDVAAFRLPALKELVLLTKSTRPIPGFASPDLVRLGFDDRPGKELVAGLRSLRELLVWRWRGTDLRFLGSPPPPVQLLRIDGMRQIVTLHGLEECWTLTELEVRESRVESLAPLRGLENIWRRSAYFRGIARKARPASTSQICWGWRSSNGLIWATLARSGPFVRCCRCPRCGTSVSG